MKTVVSHLESVPLHSSPPVPIGQQLLDAGKLSDQDVAKIIAIQRSSKEHFGEIAVRLGLVSQRDVQDMLSKQYYYPGALASAHAALIAATDPFSARSEAYRTLRTELTLRWMSAKSRGLAVTSARCGQGASVLAANLAVVFAQQGLRTLVVDANLRRPRQQELFRLESEAGLSEVLTGRRELDEVIKRVPQLDNLSVLPAGPTPPNPQELIGRPTFIHFMDQLRGEVDLVILDTPPILEFADARIISHHAGSCILAVQRDVTRVADIQKVKSTLLPTGAILLGAVVSSA